MRTVVAVAGCALVLVASACGSTGSNSAATGPATNTPKPKVGVILPDTTTSARWEDSDKPLLTSQLSFAGIQPDIQNAQGDEKRFASLADKMIAEKVNVLMITPLSTDGGAAVEKKAKAAGIPVIDYDRISLGGTAEYYVSFNNLAVGLLQAEGLVQCLGTKQNASVIEIEGASTDNNATQFHDGHEQVLKQRYDSGNLHLVGSKAIDKWSPDIAATTFTSLLDGNGGHIDGVLAANDGMAASIEAVLKQRNLSNVPVTGQDATLGGLQAVLRGTQCMTVYKPIDIEAEAASRLAIALATGRQGDADDLATGNTKDPKGNRDVKSVLLGPQSISKQDVQGLVAKGVVKTTELCAGDMVGFCTSAGIPVQ